MNLADSIVNVRLRSENVLPKVISKLSSIGFKAQPVSGKSSIERNQEKANRGLLIRLGVSAALSAQIMILSVSLYAGAQGGMGRLFQWLSLVLCLPVVFYCAVPFFTSAFKSVQAKKASIDLPIALAVVLGFLVSVVKHFRGDSDSYFDSIAMFVFLILASRYVLARFKQKAFQKAKSLRFQLPEFVTLPSGKKIKTDQLTPGQEVLVYQGEMIPVDGKVVSSKGLVSQAVLTGESYPTQVSAGDLVYAGTENLASSLKISVDQPPETSRLGKLLAQAEGNLFQKTPFLNQVDRLASFFVWAVIAGAFLSGGYFWIQGVADGFDRVIAFLIIMCPCALALATPLSFAISQSLALGQQILIIDPEVLEKIRTIRHVVLDKTGTLTQGQFEVLNWEVFGEFSDLDAKAIYALEKRQFHPVAIALKDFLAKHYSLDFETKAASAVSRIPSGGIEGDVQGVHWQIEPEESAQGNHQLVVLKNGNRKLRVTLGDQLRPETPHVVKWLQSRNLRLYLMSGDTQAACQAVSESVEIPQENIYSKASPEMKAAKVKELSHVMMLGDGLNDLLALKQADIGIATRGGMESALMGADVFLMGGGIAQVQTLIELAEDNQRVIRRNLGISLAYNLLGACAAFMGWIHPLIAAVLMPMSALTVFAFSFWRK